MEMNSTIFNFSQVSHRARSHLLALTNSNFMLFFSLQAPVEMPYKLSRSVCLQTPDLENAVRHFEKEMELTVVNRTEDTADLSGRDINLHIEKGPELGPILEIIVPEINVAKNDLISQRWTVIIWEGKEGRCRIRNPAGILFHVIEEPSAFDSNDDEQDNSF